MSDGEQKLVDTQGDYLYAVRDGQVNDGATWKSCRLIITNKRLVLATSGNKQTVPISNVEIEDEPPDIGATAHMTNITPLSVGNNVIFLAAGEGGLEEDVCRAMLHDQIILVKHPAVKGGVVQETDWEKAKFRYVDDTIKMALSDGRLTIDMDNVGNIDTTDTQVRGKERLVVSVEHTEDDISVETYLTGTETHTQALDSLFSTAVEKNEANVDQLDEQESQVLMALYSGVSPFEMSEFVGMPVDDVEEVYQHLLEIGAVDEVRVRTEVELNARGRNMASDAMSDQ
ncbi:CheF family chemotaxis protein [Halorientalis salina]|uniref:CheF family chemotaxis protein n=1 Tax=Halorientalis salina TaxID=2932266 RepID=UPI0010AB8E46|nr:CheF family chemotaxis protein [Halorientalis salina]